jgi:Protein of unknown function (DUF3300)
MTTTARIFLTRLASLLIVSWFAVTTAGCTRAYSQEQAQPWSRAELEQLVAPVALYPDALLAQLLIASTYPDEVVEAARWSQMHPELAGEDAMRAADVFDWDPSVKSLLAFPGLLARMDEKIDWTRALGDAFLAQEEDVMDAVQGLRRRARIEGTLASDDHIRIVDAGPRIQIAFASPALVYVPYYDPRVVYGRWGWPSHPPVVWAPWPGYRFVPRAPGLHVGLWWNPGVRLSVGFFFGDIDWSQRQVQVVRVDPWYVHRAIERRAPQRVVVIKQGRWHHEPTRRHLDPRRVVHAPQPAPRIEVRRPEARRPETRQAEVRKPAPRTTEVHQADTRKPAPPKPVARQAEVRKSEPPKPVVRQAEVRGPAARTPERREAELRQPSVRKPEARTVEREQPRRNTRNERTPPRETPAAQREVQQPNAGTAQRAQGRPVARETRKNDQAVQREGRREVQRDEARPNAAPERKEQNADDARGRQPRG